MLVLLVLYVYSILNFSWALLIYQKYEDLHELEGNHVIYYPNQDAFESERGILLIIDILGPQTHTDDTNQVLGLPQSIKID